MTQVSPRWTWLAALVIAAATVALRVAGLGAWPLWLDESWSRWISGQDWPTLRAYAAAYDTHPPVYYSALKLWRAAVSDTPFGMRLLSALAGIATVAMTWVCARKLPRLAHQRWPIAFAVGLSGASLPLIVASRQARPYALFALAFAVALAAALALLKQRDERGRTTLAAWTGYFLALEAVLWLHSLGILFGAALSGGLLLALGVQGRWRRDAIPFLGGHLAAGLAFLPGLAAILEQRRRWTTSWLSFDIAGVPDGLASGLAVPGVMAIPLFALGAIGLGALLRNRDERPSGLLLLCAATAPAAATVLLSIVSSPVFLPRTLAPSVVPLLLLAAVGTATPGYEVAKRATAGLCLALSLFISVVVLRQGPEERWEPIAALLQAHVAPTEEVWLLPNELVLPLGYAGRAAKPYTMLGVPAPFPAPAWPGPRPSGTAAVPGVSARDVSALIADARRRGVTGVWLISRWSILFDPSDALRTRLGGGTARPRSRRFAPLLLEHYPLPRP